MKLKLFLILSITSINLYAFDCGTYKISGVVKEKDRKLYIYINEGTNSELIFSTSKKIEPALIPYENRPFSGTAFISKKMDGTKGEIDSIEKPELRVANPAITFNNSKFELIKKLECVK